MLEVLHKKKDRRDCDSYCSISLVPHAGKVLPEIDAMRLGGFFCETEGLLPEEQCGFCPCCSTMDMMSTMYSLQELEREARGPLSLCFIDLQKA